MPVLAGVHPEERDLSKPIIKMAPLLKQQGRQLLTSVRFQQSSLLEPLEEAVPASDHEQPRDGSFHAGARRPLTFPQTSP
jgi:hypothetical protein